MREVLKHFANTVGLLANTDKSNIFMAGVDEAIRTKILEVTGFSMGNFS